MPTQIGLWMEKLSFLRRHAVVRIGGNAAAVLAEWLGCSEGQVQAVREAGAMGQAA